jgi:hypothetical protein
MAIRITGRPVTPEQVAKLLQISPQREQAIAELTGYRIDEAKPHARRARSKKGTYRFSVKRAAKQR